MSTISAPPEPVPASAGRSATPPDRSRAAALVAFLVMAAAVLLGFLGARPPAPATAGAPPAAFSAARAMEHVRAITRAPHPVGTEEHARVRAHLATELQKLGLETQVQTATAIGVGNSAGRAGTVHNVLGRLPGTGSTGAVLLMAHYDAVPGSFGAGDDAAGVAAILEALRALRTGPALRNDVIVLFSDAEEMGLLGAQAFHDEHPWARDVALVLNFEGRGHAGPAYLFQTSTGNGRLVREAAAALRHPAGNSLMGDVYRRLPNDTDLTVFLRSRRPVHGLNFGFVNGHTHYHTPLDRAEELSPRSLQHHGEYALSLARRFGGADLRAMESGDRVFFNVPGLGMVHYPAGLALPLAVLGLLGFAAAVAVAARRRALTAKGVALGLAALLLSVAAAAAVAVLGWRVVLALHPGYRAILQGDTYNAAWYFTAFAALVSAAVLAVYAFFRRRASAADLAVAPLFAWTLLALATAVALPGGSYLFAWPLFLGLAAFAVSLRPEGSGVRRAAVLALLAVPALLVFPPLLRALEVALTFRSAAVPMVVLALLLALLAPQLEVLSRPWRRVPPLAFLGLGVVALAAAAATSGWSAEHRRPNSMGYLVDTDAKIATWFSYDDAPDAWTRQFLGQRPVRDRMGRYGVYSSAPLLRADAPVLALPGATVQGVASTPAPGGRSVTFRVVSPRRAQRFMLFVEDSAAALSGVHLNGRPLPNAGDPAAVFRGGDRVVTYYGAPPEGVEVRLTVRSPGPVRLRIVEGSYGFPDFGSAFTYTPRPGWMMSKPFITTDMHLVSALAEI